MTVAAALVAAAPASAQRASLADRVAALERQESMSRSSNVDLLEQVNELRREVVSLRSQIEELQHGLEQLRETSRAQYLDADGRLNRLEGGMPAPALPDPDGDGDGLPVPVPDSTAGADAPAPRASPAQDPDERAAYEAAFSALRAGEYERAADLFEQFLQVHPSGNLAPNAHYWLGESFYVLEDYERAQRQFEALIEQFPEDSRAPRALLKVGLSQFGRQQLDAAEETLAAVVERYPGSDAAVTADDRLRAIRLSRLR
ncbi:MAG: tol-pal system protein YbgF [Gammaproteobacteria bacterium]|nr:tol-pal system protein YbgF [Gammaproteobacteria bacterium]